MKSARSRPTRPLAAIGAAALVALVVGCGGRPVEDPQPAPAEQPAAAASDRTPPVSPPAAAPSPPPSEPRAPVAPAQPAAPALHPSQRAACQGSRDFGFRVWAAGLGAWEGQEVFAFSTKHLHSVTNYDFAIRGTVTDGGFDLACENALREDLAYPGIVVWIDLDGSGICEGDRDALGSVQLYGWLEAAEHQVTPTIAGQHTSSLDVLCERVNSWL